MKILFETLEEKEEFIEDNADYDEEEEIDIYICPACHKRYEDFECAMNCCPCSEEEAYGNGDWDNDDDDDEF